VFVNQWVRSLAQLMRTEKCRKTTREFRTPVSLRHKAQLAIFLATKLFEEVESASIEIDHPLYWRRSSASEIPLFPRTIVPTR
jgi:hypothetical protein